MSARANASAKQRRAGGAGLPDNNSTKIQSHEDISSLNSSNSQNNQNRQPISVKQAIILLNSKLNALSQTVNNGNFRTNNNDMNVQYGTLEMRVSEISKKNELINNELTLMKNVNKEITTLKNDLVANKKNVDDLKDMLLKLQTSVSELQTNVLKSNK